MQGARSAMKLLVTAALFVAMNVQAQPRPQIDEATAARLRMADYLAAGPSPWVPPAAVDVAARPDFVVAADGSGTHLSVQAAIDAVPAAGPGARRHVVQLRPGVYREHLCVKDKAPITLLGDVADASAVLIVEGRYNAMPRPAGQATPCLAPTGATFGTGGSASVMVFSDDFHAAHLTLANDAMDRVQRGVGYPPGAGESGGAQAVALMTQGDRIVLDQVRLLGHQDTLYASRAAHAEAARVLVRRSLIAGDVDFIFGNATLVIDQSTLHSRAGRRTPGNGGHVLAPSTAPGVSHGFLVQRSVFVGEPGLASGAHSLGRAWDHGVARGAWQAGRSPNGQALVRDSLLGRHVGPWSASTSRRPFAGSSDFADRAANRMAEFANQQADDDSREVLALEDGWAALGEGTRGGAEAAMADVHEVRTRAQLVAALSPHGRPRIVKVVGAIDLASGDDGRPLGFEDFRDPAFDLAAYARAYDPAVWGRQPLAGPLEEARQRSARRQASHIVLRVPSRTTLLGVGSDARLSNGMLLLEQVEDVIVRNLHFSDAYDHFPAWDPKDVGAEWNSDYDSVSLRNARRVWIDRCSFDDGARPDAAEPVLMGTRMQRHDGLLDITRQSDRVTVSWSRFARHAKTMLIGSGDGVREDQGRLRVTLHHNHWDGLGERMPRVRWGRVHVYNNLYSVGGEGAHPFGYALGVGVESRLFSEHNVWQTPPDVPATRLVRLWKGHAFFDRGSLHNGEPVDLLAALRRANPGAGISGDVGWRPVLHGPIDAAAEVPRRVLAGAGAGRPGAHTP